MALDHVSRGERCDKGTRPRASATRRCNGLHVGVMESSTGDVHDIRCRCRSISTSDAIDDNAVVVVLFVVGDDDDCNVVVVIVRCFQCRSSQKTISWTIGGVLCDGRRPRCFAFSFLLRLLLFRVFLLMGGAIFSVHESGCQGAKSHVRFEI
jgi:hypothetical protein